MQVRLPRLVENRWNLLTGCARADELASTVIAVWLGAVGAARVLQGLEHLVHVETAVKLLPGGSQTRTLRYPASGITHFCQ